MGVCVGIDVSKQQLDWVLGSESTAERTPNTRQASVYLLVIVGILGQAEDSDGHSTIDYENGHFTFDPDIIDIPEKLERPAVVSEHIVAASVTQSSDTSGRSWSDIR